MEDSFSTNQEQRGWFGDDSSAVGFELLWGSNAAADLTGEAAQMVMQAVGSGCKYGWSLTGSPATHLPFNLVLRPQTSTGPGPRGWGPRCKTQGIPSQNQLLWCRKRDWTSAEVTTIVRPKFNLIIIQGMGNSELLHPDTFSHWEEKPLPALQRCSVQAERKIPTAKHLLSANLIVLYQSTISEYIDSSSFFSFFLFCSSALAIPKISLNQLGKIDFY